MKQLPKTKFNKNHFFALSKRLFKVVGVQHIGSSLHGWTLGLDILALSVASIDSQWIGLYALIFKLTNFIGAIPGALLNGYQVFFAQKNSQNLFKNSINELISALKNILILYATVALCVIFFHDPILSLLLKDQAIPELFSESKIQWIVLITFYLLIVLLGTVINNFLATKMNLFRLFMTTQLPWTITAIMACTVWYYTRIDGLSGAFSIVFGVLVAALIWLFMNILALRSYHRDQNK